MCSDNRLEILRSDYIELQVIDEADRLLAQSFQDWLAQVLAAIRTLPQQRRLPKVSEGFQFPYPDALSPASLSLSPVHADTEEKPESSCQKLLFSATLTRDPGKIAALELRHPKYFVVQNKQGGTSEGVLDVVMEKFSFPIGLTVTNSPESFDTSS